MILPTKLIVLTVLFIGFSAFNLLAKVRQEKNKEKKDILIFVGLICGVVAVTGIIASF